MVFWKLRNSPESERFLGKAFLPFPGQYAFRLMNSETDAIADPVDYFPCHLAGLVPSGFEDPFKVGMILPDF